jgi:hypothetical protein
MAICVLIPRIDEGLHAYMARSACSRRARLWREAGDQRLDPPKGKRYSADDCTRANLEQTDSRKRFWTDNRRLIEGKIEKYHQSSW